MVYNIEQLYNTWMVAVSLEGEYMSEFAPGFPLFIGSVVYLFYCFYYITFKKDTIKSYGNYAKFLFYGLLVISFVTFIWGLVFVIIYWLS